MLKSIPQVKEIKNEIDDNDDRDPGDDNYQTNEYKDTDEYKTDNEEDDDIFENGDDSENKDLKTSTNGKGKMRKDLPNTDTDLTDITGDEDTDNKTSSRGGLKFIFKIILIVSLLGLIFGGIFYYYDDILSFIEQRKETQTGDVNIPGNIEDTTVTVIKPNEPVDIDTPVSIQPAPPPVVIENPIVLPDPNENKPANIENKIPIDDPKIIENKTTIDPKKPVDPKRPVDPKPPADSKEKMTVGKYIKDSVSGILAGIMKFFNTIQNFFFRKR